MRRFVTLAIMYFVSNVLGAIVSPPDPYSYLLLSTILLALAIGCYFVGLREGRIAAAAAGSTKACQ